MASKRRTVADVELHHQKPTKLSVADLHHWIIWQFPKRVKKGMCAAVHPPIAQHGWFPAVVKSQNGRIWVHAHTATPYDSPEAAAAHFEQASSA